MNHVEDDENNFTFMMEDKENKEIVDLANYKQPSTTWIVDSGASSHICKDIKKFVQLNKLNTERVVETANGKRIPITGIGNAEIREIRSQH